MFDNFDFEGDMIDEGGNLRGTENPRQPTSFGFKMDHSKRKQYREYDPYKILKVPYDVEIDELRAAFKKIVRVVHPDKGGSAEAFDGVKRAYGLIYKEIKERQSLHERENMTTQEFMGAYNNMETPQFFANQQEMKEMREKFKNNPALFNEMFEATYQREKFYDDAERVREYERKRQEELKRLNNPGAVQKYREPVAVNFELDASYEMIGADTMAPNDLDYIGSSYGDFTESFLETDCTNIYDPLTLGRENIKTIDQYMSFSDKQTFREPTKEELHYQKVQKMKQDRTDRLRAINQMKQIETAKQSNTKFLEYSRR